MILYLVIPCYNEQEVLHETAKQLKEKMNSLCGMGKISPKSRIVFVDDGSKDKTWEIISELHKSDSIFRGIKLSRNKGHQNALMAGLMTVKDECDAAISLDADLQDDIDAIDGMTDKYLNEKFDNVYKIGGFNTVYINNKVSNTKTLMNALKRNPLNIKEGYEELYKKARKLSPDVIVTDFEIYATMVSKLLSIPLISLDNIHMITQTAIDYPPKHQGEMLKAKGVIKSYVIKPKIHILTSFFYPKIKPKKRAVLYPPVIREDILKLEPTIEDHIIVYQTSKESVKLVEQLKSLNEKFIVYGFNKDKTDENLTYKLFNEDEFYNDLASAKAVICNGGFTFISEAISLKKPIYSVPAIGNFEQTLNGFYVQKLGYGEYHEKMSPQKVEKFLKRLSKYQKKLAKVKKTNNDGIVNELIYRIEKYSKKS